MTQQVFAQFIETSPATLSSIFTGRTNPSLNIVEAIHRKIPDINIDWLMFGFGTMYKKSGEGENVASETARSGQQAMLDFDMPAAPTPQGSVLTSPNSHSVRNTRLDATLDLVKNIDKMPRKVTEIRVFYDDQTWESFVPAKSK